jgi:hypothetical protein
VFEFLDVGFVSSLPSVRRYRVLRFRVESLGRMVKGGGLDSGFRL